MSFAEEGWTLPFGETYSISILYCTCIILRYSQNSKQQCMYPKHAGTYICTHTRTHTCTYTRTHTRKHTHTCHCVNRTTQPCLISAATSSRNSKSPYTVQSRGQPAGETTAESLVFQHAYINVSAPCIKIAFLPYRAACCGISTS